MPRHALVLVCLAAGGCAKAPPAAPQESGAQDPARAPVSSKERTYGFDADRGGRLPAGFSLLQETADGHWRVEAQPVAASIPHVLKWNPKGTGEGRALAIDSVPEDADLSVQVRAGGDAPSGEAGILLGWQDAARYWAVSWDPAARRCRILCVAGETREILAEGSLPAEGSGPAWETLSVECRGDTISCFVNGVPCGAVRDRTFAPGRAGLFARGGPFLFDDFALKPR